MAQVIEQRAAEAGDDAAILGQLDTGFGTGKATRQSDDAQHAGMIHQRIEQTGLGRQRQFQHHLLVVRQRVERLDQFVEQDRIGFRAFRRLDVHFRLDDRHQPGGENLLTNFKLLLDHGSDAFAVGEVDDRTLLGAEHAQRLGAVQQHIEIGVRLHQLNAIGFILQPLVDLDEGHDALVDQRLRGGLAIDGAVHRALEQDRAQHLVAGEDGRGDDAAAHRVDQAEHFLVIGPSPLFDAIALERLGRRTAALVERGDETITVGDFLFHGLIQHLHIPSS